MIKSFYILPVFLSSKNCNKNLLINDRSQVHSPRYKLSTLHISFTDGVGHGPGLKTDYKLRLWSERVWGWGRELRLTCAKLEDVTVTEDERRGRVGRGEARPGLRVGVARPTLYLQTTWFQIYLHLQYVYNVWGWGWGRNGINWIWGKWNWMVLFLQALLFGEKRMSLWQLFCKLFSLQPSLPFA